KDSAMGAIVISTTHRSAQSLGILAEASSASTAIRNLARQLIEQRRLPSLPVSITDTNGFIIARLVSWAAATHPKTYSKDFTACLLRRRATSLSVEARA